MSEGGIFQQNCDRTNLETSYKENSEFNQQIDDEYGGDNGLIEIGNVTFQPSEILFNMDQIAYYDALKEFRDRKTEELKEIVVSQFPTPIAQSFYSFEHGYENNLQRLSLLKDTWESIIYTIYAIVVGEFRCSKIPLKDTFTQKEINNNKFLSTKLWDKLEIIEKLLRLGSERGYGLLCLDVVQIDAIEKLKILNKIRNDEMAHETTPSDEEAGHKCTENLDLVLSVLNDLQGLKDLKLMRFLGSSKESALSIRCETFVGHYMSKTIDRMEIPFDQFEICHQYLNKNQILVNSQKTIFSVSPFLYFATESNQTKLCFYKKRTGKKPDYTFIYRIVGQFNDFRSMSEQNSKFQAEIDEISSLLNIEEK